MLIATTANILLWRRGEVVNTLPFHGNIRGFKSRRRHQFDNKSILLLIYIKDTNSQIIIYKLRWGTEVKGSNPLPLNIYFMRG